jgi:hypothetical protein
MMMRGLLLEKQQMIIDAFGKALEKYSKATGREWWFLIQLIFLNQLRKRHGEEGK